MATTGQTSEARAAAFERFSASCGASPDAVPVRGGQLRVADALVGGPRPIAEVAREVGADPDALERILRALVAMGVFTQPEPASWASPTSVSCSSRGPGSTRHNAIFFGDLTYRTWGGALQSALTGRPAFDELFGAPFFDYLAEHPDDAETFNRAMEGGAAARLPPLLERDWRRRGDGRRRRRRERRGAARAARGQRPSARDRLRPPERRRSAQREIEEDGLAERCTAVGGSFFDEAPAGGDVYLLAQILHDWADDDAVRILRRIREAMRDDALLLVLELIVPEDDRPHPSKLVDLRRSSCSAAGERTRTQWADLLRRGGFELADVTDGVRASVIEARPII